MSENGPREGTKDLPRRDPESGHRSVEPDSPSGQAYERNAREEGRRRLALRELVAAGLATPEILARYRRDHPFERDVTPDEIDRILAEPVLRGSSPRHRRSK